MRFADKTKPTLPPIEARRVGSGLKPSPCKKANHRPALLAIRHKLLTYQEIATPA